MRSDLNKPVHVGAAWRVVLRDLNLDEVAILRAAGLPPALFQGDGTYISLEDFYALYDAIEAATDDPTIPLQAGSIVSVELFDPALFAAICSPDLNTATRRIGEFKRLVGVFSLDVDVGSDETCVRYRCKQRPDIPRILGLTEMVFQVAFARRATRHEIVPRRVTVQRLPAELGPFVKFFGCPLTEDAACSVVFSAEDASRPFLTHNARMWEAFEPSLRRRMAEAGESRSTTDQVQAALFELLPSGRTQMSDVAKELGIGQRTLQRRLAAEDTTWLDVLNQTRERLARHYLGTTRMSPAEVSFLLGFEDPNSLFRAFQRWTGTTPESWRADARGLD
jgi:AraC-like DNA-binding protein